MAEKTRDGETALDALNIALKAMRGPDTDTAGLRYACLMDLRTETDKMLGDTRKQEESEAKLALASAQARLKALGLNGKPKRGRPEGSRNKKTEVKQ